MTGKQSELDTARATILQLEKDLELMTMDPGSKEWAERLRESRGSLLRYNVDSIAMEKKCAEREAEVTEAEMKLETTMKEKAAALAEAEMIRDAAMMDTKCLEDAVADTLMKKEEDLLAAKAACKAAEKREYHLQLTLKSVTGTAISVQEQLEAYSKALQQAASKGTEGEI